MAEGKTLIDMLDETIDNIERRQGYLRAKMNFENDEVAQMQIKNELRDLAQQYDYTIETKKTVEIEMQRAKDEAERRRLENLFKASLFIGMMRERARASTEYDSRHDKDVMMIQDLQYERDVERAFGSLMLSFVPKDIYEELRERMEMWKVREKLPKGGSITREQMQKAVDDEYKSWSKIEHLKRTGTEQTGLDKTVSEWSAECAMKAFKIAKDIRDSERDSAMRTKTISPEQKEVVKFHLAGMVLKQLIDIEKTRPQGEDRSHYEALSKPAGRGAGIITYENLMRTRFETMSKEIAKDPDFLKSYNKYMKDGTFTTRTIKFIAEDMDKKIATELSKRPPVLKKEGPVLQPNPYNE